MFSIVSAPIYIPTNSVGGFLFLQPSPGFICRLFDDGVRWDLTAVYLMLLSTSLKIQVKIKWYP